jgi:L,D-transpeptidase catalytic domain
MAIVSRRQILAGSACAALTLSSGLRAAPPMLPNVPNPDLLRRALGALSRNAARLDAIDRIGIVDFSVPSRCPRFHILDVATGYSRNLLVTHGRGSDPNHQGWLQRFSNTPGSAASSSGAYVTGDRYTGKHGASRRLIGLDPENSNAERRAIVIHAAAYVSTGMAAERGKIGRSEGCFAVAQSDIALVLEQLGSGRI